MATKDLPFVSIGIGQPIADPFLAFIRRIFWPDRLPNLSEGIFAVLWTLQHAIKTAPAGIGDPPQIIVLEQADREWKAREILEADMAEHKQSIESAEKALTDYGQVFKTAKDVEPPPTPPK